DLRRSRVLARLTTRAPAPAPWQAQTQKRPAKDRSTGGTGLRGPLPRYPRGSGDVLADQLGHLEHGHLALAEDGLELVVRVDHPPVGGVLEIELLDVVPELLGDLRARHRLFPDHRCQRGAGLERRHEGGVRLALGGGLLGRCLLRCGPGSCLGGGLLGCGLLGDRLLCCGLLGGGLLGRSLIGRWFLRWRLLGRLFGSCHLNSSVVQSKLWSTCAARRRPHPLIESTLTAHAEYGLDRGLILITFPWESPRKNACEHPLR